MTESGIVTATAMARMFKGKTNQTPKARTDWKTRFEPETWARMLKTREGGYERRDEPPYPHVKIMNPDGSYHYERATYRNGTLFWPPLADDEEPEEIVAVVNLPVEWTKRGT